MIIDLFFVFVSYYIDLNYFCYEIVII